MCADSNHSILLPRYWNGTSILLVVQQLHCNVAYIGRRGEEGGRGGVKREGGREGGVKRVGGREG